jgi:hypothetical protein
MLDRLCETGGVWKDRFGRVMLHWGGSCNAKLHVICYVGRDQKWLPGKGKGLSGRNIKDCARNSELE